MAHKKERGSKENLLWKIDYLAAQIGQDARFDSAKAAASARKSQKNKASAQDKRANKADLENELKEMRLRKLQAKLHQARKELRSQLKKSKATDALKLQKKLRDAQKSLEKEPSTSADTEENEKTSENDTTAAKKRPITAEHIKKIEKDLEASKGIDLDVLAEKTLRSKILKHRTLKHHELVALLFSEQKSPGETNASEKETNATEKANVAEEGNSSDQVKAVQADTDSPMTEKDQTLTAPLDSKLPPSDMARLKENAETRLLASKLVQQDIAKLLQEMEAIIIGRPAKPAKDGRKETQQKEGSASTGEKRKDRQSGDPSMFVSSLQGTANSSGDEAGKKRAKKDNPRSTDWVDPDFDKYYKGIEKKNRPGQRARRQKWEEMYGDKAKHVQAEREKDQKAREEKAKQQVKNKSQKPQIMAEDMETFHPSWQAKRQQQEMMAKALSGQGGANKKIVFDDTD
ncbi:uncharacterized protein BYT42DRAFT_572965 [Radiomyces spectabilis]|uniref:uncharacterized protein n=1 Tax=Radiomyces spectabilis TaxID=64574 RepID=UPI00221FDCF7|nr:uncharacterized protein BYT42DRAFT_572965 [Radiomyces spectabilis]KAI8375977.1 hypothetical protein BYT42DRAFT_572965 [Radiomyces spectabilis]